MDGLGKLNILANCCQIFVDAVPGCNNGVDVGCVA